MKIINNKLNNKLNIRTEKDFPIKGVEFIDITTKKKKKKIFNEIVEKFVEELKEKRIDYIVMPEARGFLFGTSVANRLNIGCIPVRKKGKLPPTTVEKQFEYKKEYGKDIMEFPKLVNEKYNNKRFYIIDDICATGNTLDSIKKNLEDLGGIVVGEGVVLNIAELNNNKKIFSLIDVNEE